jgi:DNA-directed RNA polymerase subunit RPC12/RpoP
VEFAAGTNVLLCPYCGFRQEVGAAGREVREHPYAELATLPRKALASIGAHTFVCQRCGARTESDALAERCQFCAAPLVADAAPGELIAPEAVLPFAVDRAGVRTALGTWTSSRWFAPASLKKVTETETLKGTYLPHWTFDARTVSHYQGQRGEYYYVSETYSVTVNGKSETRTRQVRRTRWHAASGTVRRDFNDVLVPATGQLPGEQLDRLAPWPLEQAVPYQPDYLAGYHAVRYDTEPEAGLTEARARMAPTITKDCEQDIGGDEQRVTSVDTQYSDVTYKLVLLPVWIAAYLHHGKSWQILVNARTGEVIGERPYSVPKIVAAVLAALALVAAIIMLYLYAR